MRPLPKQAKRITGLALLTALLMGCVAQLAPPYDQAVVDGLNATNTQTMTIFASASAGTQPDTFATRAEAYNKAIGQLDALALLAAARPVPRNRATDAVNHLLEKRGSGTVVDDDSTPPSVAPIRKISETLVKMRDTDRVQGVKPGEVAAFKGQAAISFDQAITYENFLKR